MIWSDPHIIQLPRINDPRGNLTYLQFPEHMPFLIKRVFWTYDVPGGEQRGGHAYHTQQEFVIALSGSFDLVLTHQDGSTEKFALNRSYYGLYLPPSCWRHMDNFSTNALALHISDQCYSEKDYFRNFEEWKTLFVER